MNSDAVWDLVVVGAGPAGASTALAALRVRPELRVLLLDRADFPRDKCCGDGVAPHAVEVLASLGAGDVVAGWAPVRRLDLSLGQHRVAGTMARPAWVIPRQVFDARIVEHAVAAGAVLRRHRVRSLQQDGAELLLDGAIRARLVVGADGAHSAVRRALHVPGTARTALALRGYAPTPPGRRGQQVIRFGDRSQPSYAWTFDRGDGLSNVGYGELVGDGEPPTRALMLTELERLLPGSTASGGDWRGHHLPLSGLDRRVHPTSGRVLLVGDAADLVNPMTGEGIYYAVATGALAGRAAAEHVVAGTPDRAALQHRRAVQRLLGSHLRHTWAAGHLSRHPRVVGAGIRAAARDPHVFHTLVELGLGDGRITPRLAARLAVGLLRT
ncbi:geranylgeranyl reductase family protein [Nocardioides nanhaiensis]|uniref:FAD-binding domain-containing protein n=1 Tax=Nocardioides nanhaiensis TaxID=1476871 RepID=A0ABP8WA66_9ACTN